MVFHYDDKNGHLTDDETGIVVRRGGRPDIQEDAFIFFDPSNPTKLWERRGGPGEVQLHADLVYAAPPSAPVNGSRQWSRLVGYHVNGMLPSFYARPLKVHIESPEVATRVRFAQAKVREALTVM